MQNIHSELLRYMFILKEKDKVADGNRMELLLLWRRTMNEDVDILPSTERKPRSKELCRELCQVLWEIYLT